MPIVLPIREARLELAAGWFALLGTDGLVVSIVLPIREVMLGLIRLLVLVVERFVITLLELFKFKLLLLELLTLDVPLLELSTGRLTVLPDVFLVSMELPIRDVMLGLILLFEMLGSEAEELSTGRLTALRVLILLRLDWFDIDEFDLVVICRPNVLELGALVRELIDRLDMLLLGARLVIALLEMLLLGALVRELIDLLDVFLLGARLVMALLELLLLGVRLVTLRLDETLLERLDDDLLGVALGAGAGFEAGWLCLLELLDLLLLDRDVAANTGS